MHYFDEFKGQPNTEQLAILINSKFNNGKRDIYVYPDPTGKARKTSAPVGHTDLKILAHYGLKVRARRKSPAIVDSVNAVNKQLETAAGEVSMYFHPKCKETIRSMERTVWLDRSNKADIDKSNGDEHFSDGIRYATEFLFPILQGVHTHLSPNF